MTHVVFMGIQGSGKGTQAGLVAERYGLLHINVGDRFRWHIQNSTPLGLEARRYVENGELVPDSVVFSIIEEEMKKADRGYILDGFPRNRVQADYLLEHFTIDQAILFHLDDETAITRLEARRACSVCKTDYNLVFRKPAQDGICDKCGGAIVQRVDDRREAIEKRLQEFHAQTDPVIDTFRDKGILVTIPAEQPIETIHQKVVELLQLS
jgi:adenylate kinase